LTLVEGGRHLATYGGTTTYFHNADWLGTERVRTDVNGNIYGTCQGLPYGDGQVCVGGEVTPMHLTGKHRDTETNLDDFPARYYSSVQGRWLSPDWDTKPVAVPYAILGNPQTLNLYSYVGGDPTNHADPDGHACYNRNGCNTVTVTRVDTIGTHANQDGTTTTVTQTTTATFSTAKGHEGQFLGATTKSTVTITGPIGGGEPVTLATASSKPLSISQGDAVKAIGSKAFADAQLSAVPSFAAQFVRVTAQDAREHPGKYVFAAGEVGLIFTPLPEALAAIEGMHEVKAAVDAGLAAGDLSYELTSK
jgi:RHS repeat-associated protein